MRFLIADQCRLGKQPEQSGFLTGSSRSRSRNKKSFSVQILLKRYYIGAAHTDRKVAGKNKLIGARSRR